MFILNKIKEKNMSMFWKFIENGPDLIAVTLVGYVLFSAVTGNLCIA
jgi:hypothetical protein